MFNFQWEIWNVRWTCVLHWWGYCVTSIGSNRIYVKSKYDATQLQQQHNNKLRYSNQEQQKKTTTTTSAMTATTTTTTMGSIILVEAAARMKCGWCQVIGSCSSTSKPNSCIYSVKTLGFLLSFDEKFDSYKSVISETCTELTNTHTNTHPHTFLLRAHRDRFHHKYDCTK